MARPALPFWLRWRRRLRSFAWTLLLVMMLALLWWANRPPPLAGAMLYASDGDSLVMVVAGERRAVRLVGIDAPERGQSCRTALGQSWDCGAAATGALRQMVPRGAMLDCQSRGQDRFDRALSRCTLPGGSDIAARLVNGGWAIATTEDYLIEEAAARAARRGLWAGRFDPPAAWRAAHPRN